MDLERAKRGQPDGRSGLPTPPAYAVCGTPRCGSSLLCKSLGATGLAGDPDEHFWNWRESVASGYSKDVWVHWKETPWARDRSMTDWGEFAAELAKRKAGANGVFGVKLMGTYFDELLARLREQASDADLSDAELLDQWLPSCRFVRVIRRDRLRQAVSWVIADQTGVYNSTWPHPPRGQPEFDPWMIDDRCRRIARSEARWDEFFGARGLEPMTLVYEDFAADVEETVLRTLEYLEIDCPEGFAPPPPTLTKQATPVNDEWVERYLDWRASAKPDD